MITIDPEFPYQQGPELLSIVPFVNQMILQKVVYVFGVEESLSSDSVARKQVPKQLFEWPFDPFGNRNSKSLFLPVNDLFGQK